MENKMSIIDKELEQRGLALSKYREAINKSDDYFEYMYESTRDRDNVGIILDNLTQDLKKIYGSYNQHDKFNP